MGEKLIPVKDSHVIDLVGLPQIRWKGPDGGWRLGMLFMPKVHIMLGITLTRATECITIFDSTKPMDEQFEFITEPHSDE